MIRKAAILCPHSSPKAPHYFTPIFRNQEACCVPRPMPARVPIYPTMDIDAFWYEWQQDQISSRDEYSNQEIEDATEKL